MEDNHVGYFKQTERFDYITIDLDKKFFCIEVVHIETNTVLLKISINLEDDETIVEGNVRQYDSFRLDDVVQSFKRTAQICIEHDLWNTEELFNFLKTN
ncbi:hypothetical protein D0U04_04100 [Bacillus clarus]|uniref:MinD family ATPase domain protein n=1 Tax=Bacillus clarus TaxID=2338372 RepID=A0A090YUR1_9BACI|nr:hypothetical protein [Bacillus clarus]KFN02569.1 minD family ATPase domain protein [Bacillus clarus]RFT68064.1 hypothetical protein D0U04_04100 [Bacillus clarus]